MKEGDEVRVVLYAEAAIVSESKHVDERGGVGKMVRRIQPFE